MSARSHRLAGPVVLTGGDDDVLYTVPEGYTALVKSMRFVSIADAGVVLDVCEDELDAHHALFWAASVSAGKVLVDESWWVLESGHALRARCSEGGALVVWVSGAVLV